MKKSFLLVFLLCSVFFLQFGSASYPSTINKAVVAYGMDLNSDQLDEIADNFDLVDMNFGYNSDAVGLHTRHADIKVLGYRDLVYARSSPIIPDWSTILANPSWFLKDVNGDFIFSPYWGCYVMDIGNTSYQQHVIDWLTTQFAGGGYDGVFCDDVWYHLDWYSGGFNATVKSEDASAWVSDMTGFIEHLVLDLGSYLVVVNSDEIESDDYLDVADGQCLEYFVHHDALSNVWLSQYEGMGADFGRKSESGKLIFALSFFSHYSSWYDNACLDRIYGAFVGNCTDLEVCYLGINTFSYESHGYYSIMDTSLSATPTPTPPPEGVVESFFDDFEDGLGLWCDSVGYASPPTSVELTTGEYVSSSHGLLLDNESAIEVADEIDLGSQYVVNFQLKYDAFSSDQVLLLQLFGDENNYINFTYTAGEYGDNFGLTLMVDGGYGESYTAGGADYAGLWQDISIVVQNVDGGLIVNVIRDGVMQIVYLTPTEFSQSLSYLRFSMLSGDVFYVDDVSASGLGLVSTKVRNSLEGDYYNYEKVWAVGGVVMNSPPQCLYVYEESRLALIITADDEIFVYDLDTGELLTTIPTIQPYYFPNTAMSVLGSYVISAVEDYEYGDIEYPCVVILKNGAVLQIKNMYEIDGWEADEGYVGYNAISPSGEYFVAYREAGLYGEPEARLVLFKADGVAPSPSTVPRTPAPSFRDMSGDAVFYVILLVIFAVISVVVGLWKSVDMVGNRGVGLLLALVGLMIFVVLVIAFGIV